MVPCAFQSVTDFQCENSSGFTLRWGAEGSEAACHISKYQSIPDGHYISPGKRTWRSESCWQIGPLYLEGSLLAALRIIQQERSHWAGRPILLNCVCVCLYSFRLPSPGPVYWAHSVPQLQLPLLLLLWQLIAICCSMWEWAPGYTLPTKPLPQAPNTIWLIFHYNHQRTFSNTKGVTAFLHIFSQISDCNSALQRKSKLPL